VVRTLAVVDVQNIFYGLKRVTGVGEARFDYVRFRKEMTTSPEDLFVAYVVTPVVGRDSVAGIPLRDDSAFVHFMKKAGYKIQRHFARVYMEEGDKEVQFDRTSPADRMFLDTLRYLGSYDRLVIVSGSGSMIPLAEKAKEKGKKVVVASFDKAGDLNRELAALADELVHLDATYRYVKRSTAWPTTT
jgi:hypothetical protein